MCCNLRLTCPATLLRQPFTHLDADSPDSSILVSPLLVPCICDNNKECSPPNTSGSSLATPPKTPGSNLPALRPSSTPTCLNTALSLSGKTRASPACSDI